MKITKKMYNVKVNFKCPLCLIELEAKPNEIESVETVTLHSGNGEITQTLNYAEAKCPICKSLLMSNDVIYEEIEEKEYENN